MNRGALVAARALRALCALASVGGCAIDASIGWEPGPLDGTANDVDGAVTDADAAIADAPDAPDASSGWHLAPGVTTAHLRAVWGSGAADVWAVGDAGTAIHWDGISWHLVGTGTTERLSAVWGSGPSNFWAVGTNCTILHWEGASWAPASALPCAGELLGVWGGDPLEVWAAGGDASNRTLLHWTGTAWRGDPTAGVPRLLGVSGSERTSAWAVVDATSLLRWMGAGWIDVPGPGGHTGGVWSANARDAWLTGTNGRAFHFDGTSWAAQPTGAAGGLLDVWGAGVGDVWAVGQQGAIAHWDGATWTLTRGVTSEDLEGVWGTSATNVWAVGARGAVLRYGGP